MLRLGAHMSIAGGVRNALAAGGRLGCEAVQLFTKSSNQWAARPLSSGEARLFRSDAGALGLRPLAAHDSYLINLGSPDEALWRRSVEAFRIELERCRVLGINYLVAHPGAHVGSGEQAGIARVVEALDELLGGGAAGRVAVLVEITAGQGSVLGWRFEQIAEILGRVRRARGLGVCFDTCHAHAAGYDLRTAGAYEKTFAEFDRLVGIHAIRAFHLNDSRSPFDGRSDRHWHIGRGLLGLEPFRLLQNDPRFDGLPGYLETPKGEDLAEDRANLRVLRRLAGDTRPRGLPRGLRPAPGGGRGGGRVRGARGRRAVQRGSAA